MAVTPTTVQWVDAFFGSMEVVAALVSDQKRLESQLGTKLGSHFDLETYRNRKAVWKRVRAKIISLGLDIESIDFQGVKPDRDGNLIVIDPRGLQVFHEGDQTPMWFTGDEAQCMANFLAFYLDSYRRGKQPKAYVREVLASQGIDRDNFHLYRDKLAITNPWE